MTGRERIAAALRGEWPDRVPVLLHNFLLAAREAGLTQRQYRGSPAAIAGAFVRALETYGYDGALVDVDTATLAGACGVPVDFPADEPARVTGGRLPDLAAVDDLAPPDLARDPRVQVWLEAARLLKRQVDDAVHIRGNCDQCPFSLAGMMRGSAEWMMDLMDPAQHERARRLLDHCAGVTAQFLRLMADTGADMLSNGDSPAGPDVISPALYRQFAWPWERRMAGQAHALGKPYALHICGNTTPILADMADAGADALELDHKTDVRAARAALAGRVTFIGNLDPSGVLARGTPSAVRAKTQELLHVFAGTPRFILNAGCAIPATTPSENIRAMIAASREFPWGAADRAK